MCLSLKIKPFSFELTRPLKTSQGVIYTRKGLLINLKNKNGDTGWGEVAPIDQSELEQSRKILNTLGLSPSRAQIENEISIWPGSLAFGIGAALAEVDHLIDFRSNINNFESPESAFLLPPGDSLIQYLEAILEDKDTNQNVLTFKWKVGYMTHNVEERLLEKILSRLPSNARLRIDPNGAWDRQKANDWANYLYKESRLEWIEQPLAAHDIDGLKDLALKIPIALDESLMYDPSLRQSWPSWQIRRPLIEGDPRRLLKELRERIGYRVISTAFETGIGRRWVNHLAALQMQGPTPTAPGLAPGWLKDEAIFSPNPKLVWKTAA